MKILIFLISVLATISVWGADPKLFNRNATEETKRLYQRLFDIKGRHMLFGMHNAYVEGRGWTGRHDGFVSTDIERVSGMHPAVSGFDFRETVNWPHVFDVTLDQVKQAHNDGSLVTFSWHTLNPVTGGGFYDKTPAVHKVIERDSETQKKFFAKLDIIADLANKAIDEEGKHIPIIFRPWHEHNGRWFWWHHSIHDCQNCGIIARRRGEKKARQEFKKLWRLTVLYLTRVKKVNNFIYAWSPGAFQQKGYFWRYPGDRYVDILGLDSYKPSIADLVDPLEDLVDEGRKRNKVVALTETGDEGVPNPNYWTQSLLYPIKSNPKLRELSYVMVWRNSAKDESHFFGPFPGHSSVPSFQRMTMDPFIYMGHEL